MRTFALVWIAAALAAGGIVGAGAGAFAQGDIPALSATPVSDLAIGEEISVVYNRQTDYTNPDPDSTVVISGFIGICPLSADPLFEGFNNIECEGIDLSEDELSGSVAITAERFVEDRGRVVDCLESDGCAISFSVSVEATSSDAPLDRFAIDRFVIPITFEQSLSINGGDATAPTGSTVPVEAYGQTTAPGAVGFVMLCNLDPAVPGLAGLVCSGVGTVESAFDGQLVGGIALPDVMSAGGSEYDCRVGRGCLVVYAAIGPELQGLSGSGAWVRAVEPLG